MKDRSLNKPPNNALRQCSAVYYVCMEENTENKKPCKLTFTRLCGGEGGIRTLDVLLTHTRVPVVRHKPG